MLAWGAAGKGGGKEHQEVGCRGERKRNYGLKWDPTMEMFCMNLKHWKVKRLCSSKRCIGIAARMCIPFFDAFGIAACRIEKGKAGIGTGGS